MAPGSLAASLAYPCSCVGTGGPSPWVSLVSTEKVIPSGRNQFSKRVAVNRR